VTLQGTRTHDAVIEELVGSKLTNNQITSARPRAGPGDRARSGTHFWGHRRDRV